MSEYNLLDLENKALDPARYSVQSRAENSQFAPTSDVQGTGGVFWLQMAGNAFDDMPAWNSLYPNFRDRELIRFSRTEPMLSSAVYSMATRIGTLNYALNGPPRAKKYASELLTNPGLSDTLQTLVQKISTDLDTSDNGAFIELWKAGNPLSDPGTRPCLGFAHLDSRQCWRSFDPEFPVWYTNPVTGEIRKLHAGRVAYVSDNPQPIELARGIGYCATSRALRMARVFRNMQIFLDEKVGGRFTRAIGAVSGVTPKQLKEALAANNDVADSKGFVYYKDVPFLVQPSMEKGNEIKFVMQDLASIPDGFVFRDDADLYAYILAFCFGVDAREFWPATQSGATKADASVQNMKARGRGIGNRIQTVEYLIRQALPETVTFEYDFTDDDQDKQIAEIHKMKADTFKVFVDMGALQGFEVRSLAIAAGILDEEVLATAQQPLTSDDNPDNPTDTAMPTTNDAGASNDEMTTEEKSFDDYRRSLRALTRGYWAAELGAFDFIDGMVSAISRHFEQAWRQVEQQYGIDTDERTEASQDRLTLAINTEIGYISGFAQAIADNSKANGGALQPLLDRAELWAKGYDRTVLLAQATIGSDIKLLWKFGATIEHCPDCQQYEGKVFYRSQWEAAGAIPRSSDLNCNGINCLCEFEPTKQRKTPGEVPPLIGHKHLHSELFDKIVIVTT